MRGLMQYEGADVDVPDSLFERMESGVEEAIGEIRKRLKTARLE